MWPFNKQCAELVRELRDQLSFTIIGVDCLDICEGLMILVDSNGLGKVEKVFTGKNISNGTEPISNTVLGDRLNKYERNVSVSKDLTMQESFEKVTFTIEQNMTLIETNKVVKDPELCQAMHVQLVNLNIWDCSQLIFDCIL